jgi:hypothetical protein
VSGRAGDLAVHGVDTKVVGGEAAEDGRPQGRWLEDGAVALFLQAFA